MSDTGIDVLRSRTSAAASTYIDNALTLWRRVGFGRSEADGAELQDSIFDTGRSIRAGVILLFLSVGIGGVWLWSAPITSAAIAPGIVKVAGERQEIQHLEGGIVREILIEEGAKVNAGDVLIRLDPKQRNAARETLQGRLVNYEATATRLKAERDGVDRLIFDADLRGRAIALDEEDILQGEARLFTSRVEALKGQREILMQRIERFKDEIDAYEAQRVASDEQLKYIREELEAVRSLYEQGMFERPKYLALQRSVARLQGQIGELSAMKARTHQRIGETELEVIDLMNRWTSAAAQDLQAINAQILDAREQLGAATDVFERLEIRAPVAGEVVGLRYHTEGGVIPPREKIMDIVPSNAAMVIEARLRPEDIDVVSPGLECDIQLSAYSLRSTPALPGKVLQVSADSFLDEFAKVQFYKTLVEVDAAALAELEDVSLYPGMTAEVFIKTGRRSALDYLVEPIVKSMRRSMRE